MAENFAVVANFLQEGEPTGVSRYSAGLVEVLAASASVGRIVVVVPGEPAAWARARSWPKKLEWLHAPALPLWLYRRFLPAVVRTGATRLLYPASLPLCPFPGTVTVVHDLGFLRAPDAYARALADRQRLSWLLSDTLIVTSQAIRDELRTALRFSGEIVVVPPVLGAFGMPDVLPDSAGGGLRYVLMVGRWRWNKNWEVVSRAMESPLWPQDLDLVIAGSDDAAVATYFPPGRPRRGRVRSEGYVSDGHLETLWNGALAFLMPSVYEGLWRSDP